MRHTRKMFGCRHSRWVHLLFRLPLVVLWTIIVILVLYKSIRSTYPYNGDKLPKYRELPASQRALRWATSDGRDQHPSPAESIEGRSLMDGTTIPVDQSFTSTLTASTSGQSDYEKESRVVRDDDSSTLMLKRTSESAQNEEIQIGLMTTTRRSPVSDYMRRGEIYILLVQEEDVISKAHNRANNLVTSINGTLYPLSDGGMFRFGHMPESKYLRKLTIPEHIRHLIEVLKYHRIGYALDVMRTGLPSELLQNPRRYSVIVIDDFIKYDRLNRWARDQLDRHCRNHRVGVITYLMKESGNKFESSQSGAQGGAANEPHHQGPSSKERMAMTGEMRSETARQYPLAYEPVALGHCTNRTSSNCYIDYQLNDKAPLLRMVKQRPDYILGGDLRAILNAESVVTMTSNHLTHEPLTWSWLRRPTTVMLPPSRPNQGAAARRSTRVPRPPLELPRVGTRTANHAGQGAREVGRRASKRSVLPSPTMTSPFYDTGLTADDDLVGALNGDGNHGDAGGEIEAQRSASDEYSANGDGLKQGDANDDHYGETAESQFGETHSADLPEARALKLTQRGDRKVIAMLDNGLYDDIKRVIFGVSNHQWLNRLLLLDAIEHLSSGEILTPLERYIQIDIDDIFVGATGTRMNKSDVEALIETQDYFGKMIEGGFKFNLGFSGKFFKRGNEAEQLGDLKLVAEADKFSWFCHFWSHSKAHLFNSTESLAAELERNLKFARDNNLTLIGHHNHRARDPLGRDDAHPLPPTYAVAPHHSGVYPIHAELYEAWRRVLNVQTTTTEEYPHLRPANQRRGFVHGTIKVLPRQTCGLYTHTIYKNKYPGGYRKLLANIRGGELFETVVHNPVNIYMTHMSNYANDRLAPSTFKALFEFVDAHTNLRLKFASQGTAGGGDVGGPLFLADYYFSLHPEEREPIWTSPCRDKRHLAIWSARKLKLCQAAPKLLIVGPQKTGTTALQAFLELNPSIRTSRLSSEDFEEVQFFNDKHYFKGSDWYFERFIQDASGEDSAPNVVHLDKSATYFDDPKAPLRASALLPEAHILILLINPADRAYSWYQHMRAHNDPAASELSFDQVIMSEQTPDGHQAGPRSPRAKPNSTNQESPSNRPRRLTGSQRGATRALRSRCLHPGYYSNHLLKWLEHFPSRQIVIIDGEWLRLNPRAVLERLQLLLRLPHQADYDQLLVYHQPKGFYCRSREAGPAGPTQQPGVKCLGAGKGRKYAPMSAAARNYLDDHYLSHNRQLARLLYDIGQPLPRWLDRAINPLPAN